MLSSRRLALLPLVVLATALTSCLDIANPNSPGRMQAEAGNGQRVAPLARTDVPLTVQVLGQNFQMLAGVTVEWAVVSGGGSVENATTVTNAEGRAWTHYIAGGTPGPASVSATVEELGTIVFNLTIGPPVSE